jgi:thymidylate synthase
MENIKMLNCINIKARDIPDCWFQCIEACINHGRKYTIDHGSYVGQKRWELDFVTIHITHPGSRPLIPEMPSHLSRVPPPTTMDYVENDYLPYLMTDQPLKKEESYTYGLRVAPQMEEIIKRYKEHGFGSNQECISVSHPEDINLDDPPCLRQIDTRIFSLEGLKHKTYIGANQSKITSCIEEIALHFFVYFRSWDLWGGLPANLAAIRLMQEYMANCIGVEAGEIVAISKGLHLYNHIWDISKLRVGQ